MGIQFQKYSCLTRLNFAIHITHIGPTTSELYHSLIRHGAISIQAHRSLGAPSCPSWITWTLTTLDIPLYHHAILTPEPMYTPTSPPDIVRPVLRYGDQLHAHSPTAGLAFSLSQEPHSPLTTIHHPIPTIMTIFHEHEVRFLNHNDSHSAISASAVPFAALTVPFHPGPPKAGPSFETVPKVPF